VIQCPQCGAVSALRRGCDRCGFAPPEIDCFPAWAPELARTSIGYDTSHFARLFGYESGNFWFRARNRLILWALQRHFSGAQNLLEIGCGTGFVLAGIHAARPAMRLTGAEAFTTGLAFAHARVPEAELVQMDARRMPYVEAFDVVAAFDVLEHIVEDESVLRSLHRALRPGGGLLLSVPQHRWLWSTVDDAAGHVRRYHARELEEKVRAAGFEILRSTSFVSLLLPAMALSRRRASPVRGIGLYTELQIGRVANWLLERVMDLERGLIRVGASLPVGGSRLVVARKRLA
jgi:SAM-dependent methyltransferase